MTRGRKFYPQVVWNLLPCHYASPSSSESIRPITEGEAHILVSEPVDVVIGP